MTTERDGDEPVALAAASGERPGSIRGLSTLVGDLSSITGARVVTLVLSVATVLLTTRLLAPAEYAVVTYVTLGGSLIFIIASGWSSAAVMRYGREELERTGAMRLTVWARAALTVPLLAGAVALLVALKLVGVLPDECTWSFVWLTAALGTFTVGYDQLLVVLDASGRMRLSARASAIRQGLFVLGLVGLAIAGEASPLLVAGLAVALAFGLAVGLIIPIRSSGVWPPALDRREVRRVFLFALPLVAFAASQYGMRSVDIVVLRAFESPAEVGIYAVAYQSYTMLQQLGTTVTIVLVPLFVSLTEAGRARLVTRYFVRLVPQGTLILSVAGGIAAPVMVLAVPVVFGSDFADAAQPFGLLVAALSLFGMASLIGPILLMHERTKDTAAINLVALGVNVVGDLLFVGWLGAGVVGPAVATVLALAVIAIGYFVIARRALGSGPSVSPAVLLPLPAGVLPPLLLEPEIGAPVGVAACLLVGALVLWHAALFSEDDAALVERLDVPPVLRVRIVRGIRRLAR